MSYLDDLMGFASGASGLRRLWDLDLPHVRERRGEDGKLCRLPFGGAGFETFPGVRFKHWAVELAHDGVNGDVPRELPTQPGQGGAKHSSELLFWLKTGEREGCQPFAKGGLKKKDAVAHSNCRAHHLLAK